MNTILEYYNVKIKQEPEEKKAEQPKPKRTMRKGRKFFRFLQVFGIFNRNQVVKLMPFILFLTVLILFYIANSYYAERLIREINRVKSELKEKQWLCTAWRLAVLLQERPRNLRKPSDESVALYGRIPT